MAAAMETDEVQKEDFQVTCKFVTKLPDEFRVPDTPLTVPVQINRRALSQIVNHLLGLDPPKPFDFIVDGDLLRTSLEQHLLDRQISVETLLEIEYLPIVLPPKTKESAVHDDWVSALDGSADNQMLSGSYDGAVRAWNSSLECLWGFSAHESPITSIAQSKPSTNTPPHMLLTASQENNAKIWTLPHTGHNKNPNLMAILKGHTDSIQCVAISPNAHKCCTGSWDKGVRLWNYGSKLMDVIELHGRVDENEGENGGEVSVVKKRKVESTAGGVVGVAEGVPKVQALSTMEGHSGCVASVVWPVENMVVSGAWDHSVRMWDAETSVNIETYNGNKAIHSVSLHPSNFHTVAFGGADTVLRIWDARDKQSEAIKVKQFRSHAGWISCVKWSGYNENHILTASYDKTVKLWDVRGDVPLGTLGDHSDKVLCVEWLGEGRFVSGGADCTVKLHEID